MNFDFKGTILNKGKNAISITGLDKFLEEYEALGRDLGYIELANEVKELRDLISEQVEKEKQG